VRTKSLIKHLEKEKISLLAEIKELRQSVNELNSRKTLLQNQHKYDDIWFESNSIADMPSYILDELLVDCDDDPQTKEFNKFFNRKDSFIEKTRKALLED